MKHLLSRLPVRRLALLGLALGALAASEGCTRSFAPEFGSTPAFSTKERFARISRNIGLEAQMANDDIDHVLLLRPVTGLTEWNVP